MTGPDPQDADYLAELEHPDAEFPGEAEEEAEQDERERASLDRMEDERNEPNG